MVGTGVKHVSRDLSHTAPTKQQQGQSYERACHHPIHAITSSPRSWIRKQSRWGRDALRGHDAVSHRALRNLKSDVSTGRKRCAHLGCARTSLARPIEERQYVARVWTTPSAAVDDGHRCRTDSPGPPGLSPATCGRSSPRFRDPAEVQGRGAGPGARARAAREPRPGGRPRTRRATWSAQVPGAPGMRTPSSSRPTSTWSARPTREPARTRRPTGSSRSSRTGGSSAPGTTLGADDGIGVAVALAIAAEAAGKAGRGRVAVPAAAAPLHRRRGGGLRRRSRGGPTASHRPDPAQPRLGGRAGGHHRERRRVAGLPARPATGSRPGRRGARCCCA